LHVITRIAGALLGLVLFAAAFVFTSLILATAAVGALALWAWVMWRARHASSAAERGQSVVIEGEYVVHDEQDKSPPGA